MASNKRISKTLLTMDQRLEVLRHLESGVSISKLAAKYNIHPATVHRIRRSAVILNQFTEQGVVRTRCRKIQKLKTEEVDNRLHVWCLEQIALGKTLTDKLMIEKAVDIYTEYGGPSSFKASRGWLWLFKNRHNIKAEADGNGETMKQFIQNFTQCVAETGVDKENIYNFCQTSLLWRALPASFLVHSGIKDVNNQRQRKERVTIGLCTNATGKHKLVPLFIHKFANPRVLKYWKYQLPVVFKSQRQGFLDAGLFFDWYQNHFKPEVLKYQIQNGLSKKVVLILNDSQGDKAKLFERFQSDEQFKIVFFPFNTSQNVQPMNQVIDVVKKLYHSRMLCKIQSLPGGVKEFYSNFHMKECIDFLHEAWTEVSVVCIQIAWKNCIKQNLTKSSLIEDLETQLESKDEEDGDNLQNSVEDENFSRSKVKINSLNIKSGVESSSGISPDESKVIEAFNNIMAWSRQESNFVRLHVKRLKKYYEEK
ncbi:major facilitator superfamily transporter 18 isoform X1 [Megalopta genalis]|uniref:major facilitator superfamily transporter 18 isoform X1 n=1 Tax=Megalopta genalis TaxID=115081 RepID=UPI003FD53ED6